MKSHIIIKKWEINQWGLNIYGRHLFIMSDCTLFDYRLRMVESKRQRHKFLQARRDFDNVLETRIVYLYISCFKLIIF